MYPIRWFPLLALAGAALAALSPSSAAADGGPFLPVAVSPSEGIESADGNFRYVTLNGDDSIAAKITVDTAAIDAYTTINDPDGGYFGIPQVAADGSAAGLSDDGGTLVLIRSAGPIDQAKLVVMGTERMRIRNTIELNGQFSFDAISPDGRTAYVVEYPQPFRYDRYRVLKLNLRTGHLAKQPITDEDVGLDEEEEEEGVAGEMRGNALSRVSSADGRWAYTLYDGGGDVPFIHALDTVGDKAVCIFMPELEGLEGKQMRKATIASGPEPDTVSILGRADHETAELARVDTKTFAVTSPDAEVSESGSALPAPLVLGLIAVAGLGLGAIYVRRRRRGA